MTLPLAGPISTAQINTELNRSSDAPLNLSDSEVLALAEKSAGQSIQIPQDFYGKGYARGWVDTTRTITIGYDPDSTTSFGGSDIPGYGYVNSPVCGSINNRNVTDTNNNTVQIILAGARWNWLSGRFEVLTLDDTFLPDKVGITFSVPGGSFYLEADRRLSAFGYQYMTAINQHGTNLQNWLAARVGQSCTVRMRDPV